MTNDQLKSIVDRIERLNGEKQTIADDVKQVYLEAKGTGYDPKIIRKIVAKRKKDAAELQEEEALIDTYEAALGSVQNG
jgi:uncharacterized protein (UPF0335 family)